MVGYDIFRDGTLIEELWNASNFSDAMLEPATTYQYIVIAVDDDGNRSIVEFTSLGSTAKSSEPAVGSPWQVVVNTLDKLTR